MINKDQQHYDAIMDAINSGVTSVNYAGKTVAYRDLGEMMRIAQMLRAKLGLSRSLRSGTLTYHSRYE